MYVAYEWHRFNIAASVFELHVYRLYRTHILF